jgi:hypothetical protein
LQVGLGGFRAGFHALDGARADPGQFAGFISQEKISFGGSGIYAEKILHVFSLSVGIREISVALGQKLSECGVNFVEGATVASSRRKAAKLLLAITSRHRCLNQKIVSRQAQHWNSLACRETKLLLLKS